MNGRRLGAALALLLLAAVGLWWMTADHSKAVTEDAATVQPLGKTKVRVADAARANLTVMKAAFSDYPEQIDVTGKISVTENGTTVIPARAGGRIEAVLIASGEPVARGQVVAKIYSPDFAAAREEYLQAGRPGNENGDLSQLRTMSFKKLVSLGLDKQDIGLLANSDPNLLVVRAPAPGVVTDKKAMPGGAVNAGDPLFTIGDLHKVWFLGDVYPEDLPKVHEGQPVIIDPPSGSGSPVAGKVAFISPVIDPATRTIKIRILMDNPDLALRGDMYAEAHIVLRTRSAVILPATAVFTENAVSYVFRQTEDNSAFEKVAVTTEGGGGDKIVVTGGIGAGDVIVADGGLLLNSVFDGEGSR